MIALILIPWVLTTFVLLFIMVRNSMKRDDDEYMGEERPIRIRVAVYGEKAYWVHDNVFYESEVTREPDFETARPIDTMSMDPKELEELLSVLDELEKNKEE